MQKNKKDASNLLASTKLIIMMLGPSHNRQRR